LAVVIVSLERVDKPLLGITASSFTMDRTLSILATDCSMAKVKATLVDAKDLVANAFKVVTERGTVYLMGRVTEREATRAVNLVRTINGVQKVVRVFEIITEAELANNNAQPKPAADAPK
jgi:hypothetical protein